jgi:hypothetical protein
MLKMVFGSKGDKVLGDWRSDTMHNEKFSSPSHKIRVIRSRRMK